MKKSWLTAASALAAVAVEAPQASAQLFSTPAEVNFGNTLVGSSSSKTFDASVRSPITSGRIPAATEPFSGGPISLVSSMKAEVPATYSFAPTVAGDANETLVFSAVNLDLKIIQAAKIALTGVGVAPIESVSAGPLVVARIGASGLETVTVTNTGDGNLSGLGDVSNLRGALGASAGVFEGAGGSFDLLDGSNKTFDYGFAPTAHGAATGSATATFENGSADGKNQSGSQTITLSGEGVGPVYSSSVVSGGVIDLGAIKLGETGFADLKIDNISTDPTFDDPALTQLSLLTAGIPEGSGFALGNFVPDTVLSEGDSFDLKINFSASSLGPQIAELAITTDQGAAFGSIGQTFDYELTANVVAVPESQTWELLLAGFGLVGLQWRARRRRGPAEPDASGEPDEGKNSAAGQGA